MRGLRNLRAFYSREYGNNQYASYVGPWSKRVNTHEENVRYHDHYSAVHGVIIAIGVTTGTLWGFWKDKRSEIFWTVVGFSAGFAGSAIAVPMCFAYPTVGVLGGLLVTAKGAALARNKYYNHNKKD